MRISFLLAPVVSAFLVAACADDSSSPGPDPVPPTTKAVYILNEGQYGDPAGARLSLYDIDRDTVYTDVYESANAGAHLGSLGDDIVVRGDRAYVVMSGSHDLKIISTADHRLLQSATYPGADPHDVVISADGTRMFLTMLFSDSVLSIDPATLAVRRGIRVGPNPQGMALAGLRLFVCNSGFGASRTVSVINVENAELLKTIELSDGPTGVAFAPDGSVWVTCTGNAYLSVPSTGRVYVIDGSTLTVKDSVVFPDQLFGPITLGDDGYAYVLGVTPGSYYGGPVHRVSMSTLQVTMNYASGTYYALASEPETGNLYVADAKNFTGTGEIRILTSAGTVKKTFAAQRGPGKFAFTF
jgi:DNA-binding beta-propeller fold protein YncE